MIKKENAHEYHRAEAFRTSFTDLEGRFHWLAGCRCCEWLGPKRDTKEAAEADALAHDTSENS